LEHVYKIAKGLNEAVDSRWFGKCTLLLKKMYFSEERTRLSNGMSKVESISIKSFDKIHPAPTIQDNAEQKSRRIHDIALEFNLVHLAMETKKSSHVLYVLYTSTHDTAKSQLAMDMEIDIFATDTANLLSKMERVIESPTTNVLKKKSKGEKTRSKVEKKKLKDEKTKLAAEEDLGSKPATGVATDEGVQEDLWAEARRKGISVAAAKNAFTLVFYVRTEVSGQFHKTRIRRLKGNSIGLPLETSLWKALDGLKPDRTNCATKRMPRSQIVLCTVPHVQFAL
jgi:hypothetical protein